MSFDVATQSELREAILVALRNNISGLDTSTSGDASLRAGAHAHVMEGISERIKYAYEQIFPDSCDSDSLDRWCDVFGITRKDPSKASGTIEITGTPTKVLLSGAVFTKADGWTYITNQDITIGGGGTGTGTAEAIGAGSGGNVDAGEAFTITSPPAGIDGAAVADTAFTGGTDEESDSDLLARLLNRIQAPPAGGTANDWEQWCLDVDGVTEAYAFPLLQGRGTVVVVIFTKGVGGVRALPSGALLAAVTTSVDDERPVTVEAFGIWAATPKVVNIQYDSLEVEDGYDPATVAAAVEAAIEAAFPSFAPGETLYVKTQLDDIVNDVDGVKDYTRTLPAANVTATADSTQVEVLTTGTVVCNY